METRESLRCGKGLSGTRLKHLGKAPYFYLCCMFWGVTGTDDENHGNECRPSVMQYSLSVSLFVGFVFYVTLSDANSPKQMAPW